MTSDLDTPPATTTPTPLTAQDIKKFRSCDRIVFSYNRGLRAAHLDAIKEADAKTAWEQSHRLPITVRCESYQTGMRVARAFALLYNYSFVDSPVHTFLACLHVGDTLSARVLASTNNAYVQECGLHVDHLLLEIRRGRKTLAFLVEVSVCKDNTARLAQMESGSEYDR